MYSPLSKVIGQEIYRHCSRCRESLKFQSTARAALADLCSECSRLQQDTSSCVIPVTASKQLEKQVNVHPHDVIGNPKHYTSGIECWDYITSHNLGYLEGNIIKYVTRYKLKNGLEDLKKAKAYLDKLILETEKASKGGV